MKAPLIVLFNYKNEVIGYETYNNLAISFESLLPRFSGSIIIDSEMNAYFIRKAYKIGWGNKFWGFSIMWKKRLIKIAFDASETRKINFNETKQIIVNHLKQKPRSRLMIDIYGSVDEVIEKVNHSKSMKELTELFLYDE